jgi:hypothetical protein
MGLSHFLEAFPGMRVQPSIGEVIRVQGDLDFHADFEGGLSIRDTYQIRIDVPKRFPEALPAVKELGGRVTRDLDHHVFRSGALCLGSPLRLHRLVRETGDLTQFVRRVVVPFLYAVSYRERTGEAFPFGELAHGRAGLLDDYARMLALDTPEQVPYALSLLGMKKRKANKHLCPCGCGERLGRCRYNKKIRELREEMGRSFFRDLHDEIAT